MKDTHSNEGMRILAMKTLFALVPSAKEDFDQFRTAYEELLAEGYTSPQALDIMRGWKCEGIKEEEIAAVRALSKSGGATLA